MKTFDVMKAIKQSWDFLWKENLKNRNEAKTSRWISQTYYLTVQDIERQVRWWAQNTHDGQDWVMERAWGMYQYGFKFKGNLKELVRGWLFSEARAGRVEYHNFGRGHISGARFRPKGEPMGPSELETVVRKEKRRSTPRPVHFSPNGYNGRPECTKSRRSQFSSGRRSRVQCTDERKEVTCRQCLNLLVNIPEVEKTTEMELT